MRKYVLRITDKEAELIEKMHFESLKETLDYIYNILDNLNHFQYFNKGIFWVTRASDWVSPFIQKKYVFETDAPYYRYEIKYVGKGSIDTAFVRMYITYLINKGEG